MAAAQDADEPASWPVEKLLAKIQALAAEGVAQPPKGFALVLISAGLDPPHGGHLELLRCAALRLEEAGYAVPGMWLCPTREASGLSVGFRLEACSRVVASDPLIATGTIMADEPGPGLMEMCRSLQAHAQGCASEDQVPFTVCYACGADFAAQCRLGEAVDAAGGLGLVVVP